MKKKLLMIMLCLATTILCTGCFENEKLERTNITTTVYPIEYLVTRLFGEYSDITSIYPNETSIEDIENYELTDKKIKTYTKATQIFIYNGQSNEKEIAKTLLNKSRNKMNIIDVSYGLKYKYGVEELWLNPNNYLMLANTIKKDLSEINKSKYVIAKIEENYDVLIEDLTTLDAELRNIAKNAISDGNSTIVIAYDSLGFLETYGFNVINITNENNITTNIKNKFKNKEYTKIFVADKTKVSDSIKDIVDNYGVELIEINTMNTLTDKQRKDNENYLTIMADFITKLSNTVLK